MAGDSSVTLNAGTGGATAATYQDGTGNMWQKIIMGLEGATAVSANTGNADAGTIRVALATNQPTLSNAQPVAQSGSWTVTVNGVLADAATFTRGTTSLLPVGGVVEAVQSALTVGQARGLSLTTAALLRVDGSNVTQPVSGTFWQTTQPVSIAAAVTVAQATAANLNATVTGTVTANVGTTNGLALDTSVNGLLVAQGSTTSAQKGTLTLAAVTTAAPSYTTAQTSPLSLTAAGGLRVDLATILGTAIDTNSGNKSAATIRVVLATDQPSLANALPVSQSGTWTVQPGNTPNTTPWLVTDTPATSGGLSFNYQIAPATPAKTAVKASAGQLYAIKAMNLLATPVYVKLFNAASASVTLGTTNCDDQFMIPGNTAGAGVVMNIDKGVAFSTAITAAITGGIASNDNTAITGNSVVVTLYYK